MKVLGLVGRSGSGKTTLMVELVARLRRRGLTVSTMKHAHHGFEMDRPGKDSFRHREAGAEEVMVVSGGRWALLRETPDEPDVDDLIARMSPVDVLLIEGFHTHGHPAIEVHRPSLGKDMLWRPGSDIVAVASDEPLPGLGVPRLDLGALDRIEAFVLAMIGPLAGERRTRPIDGRDGARPSLA